MHRYLIKTPVLLKRLYPSYVWSLPATGPDVYLSFDDGPHPGITPWVLEQLAGYEAEATFFCIGHNVEQYPNIYRQILNAGHATGNHTYHHVNGWKTSNNDYLADVAAAAPLIEGNLFRPPYGRIRRSQAKQLSAVVGRDLKIIMWDVLSADFDRSFSPQQCVEHVKRHVRPGSIVVFHDSEKAWPNLSVALPAVLQFLREEGYKCKKIQL